MIVRANVPCSVQPRSARRGLTLVELIVVLTVLIAVAGLLVPMLPSMLTRAHTSTCSTNMGELCKALGEYQGLYSSQPYNFDALTDGTAVINYLAGSGGPSGANPTWPVGQGVGMANGEISAITLVASNPGGQDDAAMLTGVGILSVQPMVATATPGAIVTGTGQVFDPTFSYYANAVAAVGVTPTTGVNADGSIAVVDGLVLAGLDPVNNTANNGAAFKRCVQLNLSTTGRYVCLGVGQRCSMVGKTIQTAPVHFGDQPALNPEYGYQRLVAIYQISDSNPAVTLTQARLVGVAPIHDSGVGNTQDELQNWYQLTTGGS